MHSRSWLLLSVASIWLVSLFNVGGALAQIYPSKPIRIVVTFPPGGTADLLARSIGAELQASWKQPVIIDNRPGAGGNIGADNIAKSPPDGYSLLLGTNGTHAINPALYAKLPYDPVKDFSPVTLIASAPNIFTTHPSLPVKSIKDLVALAKARPKQIVYGSPGVGTAQHLSLEMFRTLAGIDMLHVPYKGAPPQITALLSGEIALSCQSISAGGTPSHVTSGRLRGLAVTTAQRSPVLPQVPTMIESGFPDFDVGVWFGILAPAGTPADVVNRLNNELIRILALPELRKRLTGEGVSIVTSTPAQYQAYIRSEMILWAKAVKDSGARVE